jgi:hypothetical protein
MAPTVQPNTVCAEQMLRAGRTQHGREIDRLRVVRRDPSCSEGARGVDDDDQEADHAERLHLYELPERIGALGQRIR